MKHNDSNYDTGMNIRRYYNDIVDEYVDQYKDSTGTPICAGHELVSSDGIVSVVYDFQADDYVVTRDNKTYEPLNEYLKDNPDARVRCIEYTTEFYNINDVVSGTVQCPIPPRWVSDIPDVMGINLVSVHGFKVVSQPDGQIKSIEIQFIPA